MPSRAASIRQGDLLAGKYRIEGTLGIGGMGVVVAATHLQLDQRVAIKFLLPEVAGQPDLVARFLREARAAARISSEHVVRVFDVGTCEDGAPYMVMERLEGRDFSQLLESHGALRPEVAVDYVLQALEAVAEAHAAGIVHRDLKPENLFLLDRSDGSRVVKVLDFGISKESLGRGDVNETATSAVLGSPLYMSPEQLRSSRDVDARSDIWSLGMILYELVSARDAFHGDTMPQLVSSILTQPPLSLRAIRPELSAEFESVVLRCLEKDPLQRYADGNALAQAIAPFGTAAALQSAERIAHVLTGEHEAVPLSRSISAPPPVPSQKGERRAASGAVVRAPASEERPTHAEWGSASREPPEPVPSLKLSVPARRRKIAVVAALGLALAGVSAVAVTRPGPATSPTLAQLGSASPSPIAAAVTTLPAAEPGSVEVRPTPDSSALDVRIAVEPRSAKLFLDNVELSENPYVARAIADGAPHRLRAVARGYESHERSLVFAPGKPVDLTIRLSRARAEAPVAERQLGPSPGDAMKPRPGRPLRTLDTADPYQ